MVNCIGIPLEMDRKPPLEARHQVCNVGSMCHITMHCVVWGHGWHNLYVYVLLSAHFSPPLRLYTNRSVLVFMYSLNLHVTCVTRHIVKKLSFSSISIIMTKMKMEERYLDKQRRISDLDTLAM